MMHLCECGGAGTHACVHKSQRQSLGVLLCHYPPYSLERADMESSFCLGWLHSELPWSELTRTHTQLRLAARDLTQVLTAARQIFWAHWAISPVQLPYFFEAGCSFSLNLELTPPSRLVSKPQRCYRLCPSSSVLDCRRVCCCTKVLCGSWGSKSSCHACAVTLHQLSHLSSLIDSDQSQKKYLVKTTQNFGTDSKPNFRIL